MSRPNDCYTWSGKLSLIKGHLSRICKKVRNWLQILGIGDIILLAVQAKQLRVIPDFFSSFHSSPQIHQQIPSAIPLVSGFDHCSVPPPLSGSSFIISPLDYCSKIPNCSHCFCPWHLQSFLPWQLEGSFSNLSQIMTLLCLSSPMDSHLHRSKSQKVLTGPHPIYTPPTQPHPECSPPSSKTLPLTHFVPVILASVIILSNFITDLRV